MSKRGNLWRGGYVSQSWLSGVRAQQIWGRGQFLRMMVTPGRLELPTRSLGNCCSIHLSYGATFIINTLREYCIFVGSQLVTE